jgi:beta-N-acetylhexosaminidase
LLAGGVLPVIKHIPGHGRAAVDSHLALPVVAAPRAALSASDFAPFRALAAMPWAMTAHIVYQAVDREHPATLSPRVIAEIIRQAIGFDGVLLSDDITMQALPGRLGARATAALAAGCDVVLHCSGDLAKMAEIAAVTPPLSAAAQRRVAAGERRRTSAAQPFDRHAAERRFALLTAAAA